MSTTHPEAASRFPMNNGFISSDFLALSSHMSDCERSRGRFFNLHVAIETLQSMASRRIVTTGALIVVCSVGLLVLI